MTVVATDADVKEAPNLPSGWVWATPGQLASDEPYSLAIGPFGSNLKVEDYRDTGVPLIFVRNIRAEAFGGEGTRFVSREKAGELRAHHASPGDLLITKMGDPPGDAALYPRSRPPAVITADCIKWTLAPHLEEPNFILYALRSEVVRRQIYLITQGVAQQKISLARFKTILLPIPPLAEQRRIVAEIEQQFSRLDAAVAALKRVQANLKRYRASVLQAACEGRLVPTEAELARVEGRTYEPASTFLARHGKGSDAQSQSENHPAIPNGWALARVGVLGKIATGATPLRGTAAYYAGGTIPWVTSGALNDDHVTCAKEYITPLAIKETNAKVFPAGTLLIALYGEGKTRGKVSELRIDAATNQACAAILLKPEAEECRPYLKLFFQKNYEDIRRLSSGGVQPNLSLSLVRDTLLPLPPIEEQHRIAAEADRQLSVIAELERIAQANLKRAERLRQSILKRAFEGNLVTQDPADEPASVLLERTRAERAAAGGGKPARNSRGRKSAGGQSAVELAE